MNFFKKYSALIFPVVLVIVAVLLLVPVKMISSSVKQSLENSKSTYNKVNRLIQKAVPRNQWKIEQAYQDSHQRDANNITELIKHSSERELIVYTIFPKPVVKSNQIFKNFGKKYIEAIDNLAENILSAGEAPSEQILKTLTAGTGKNFRGDNINNKSSKRIIDNACMDKARNIKVYANPEKSFLGYNFWKNYNFSNKEKGIKDCWHSQVDYWIQEDVAASIAEINKDAKNILDAKVKRLLGISLKSADAGSSDKEAKLQIPLYLDSDGKNVGLVESWTQRKGNDEMDVVHFSLAVIIDVKAIPEFYSVLCGSKKHIFKGWQGDKAGEEFVHNNITILQEKVEPVKMDSQNHKNYRYGSSAVVKLNLVCEYIFLRAGYDQIKPETIKEELGQNEDSQDDDRDRGRRRGRRGY